MRRNDLYSGHPEFLPSQCIRDGRIDIFENSVGSIPIHGTGCIIAQPLLFGVVEKRMF